MLDRRFGSCFKRAPASRKAPPKRSALKELTFLNTERNLRQPTYTHIYYFYSLYLALFTMLTMVAYAVSKFWMQWFLLPLAKFGAMAAARWLMPSLTACGWLLAVVLALAAVRFVQRRTPRLLKFSLFSLFLYYLNSNMERFVFIVGFAWLTFYWASVRAWCTAAWFTAKFYSKVIVGFVAFLFLTLYSPTDTIPIVIHGVATFLYLVWLGRQAVSCLPFLARVWWNGVVAIVTAVVGIVALILIVLCWCLGASAAAQTAKFWIWVSTWVAKVAWKVSPSSRTTLYFWRPVLAWVGKKVVLPGAGKLLRLWLSKLLGTKSLIGAATLFGLWVLALAAKKVWTAATRRVAEAPDKEEDDSVSVPEQMEEPVEGVRDSDSEDETASSETTDAAEPTVPEETPLATLAEVSDKDEGGSEAKPEQAEEPVEGERDGDSEDETESSKTEAPGVAVTVETPTPVTVQPRRRSPRRAKQPLIVERRRSPRRAKQPLIVERRRSPRLAAQAGRFKRTC